jgi:endoglucanase
MTRVLVLLLAVLSLMLPASPAEAGPSNWYFNRGINLSRWFWKGERTPDYWARYVTLEQLRDLKSMGFDHVRIPMDVDFMFDPQRPSRLAFAGPVRVAVRMARTAGLAVILDPLHNSGTDFETVNMDSDAFVEDKLVPFMGAFAKFVAALKMEDGTPIPPATVAIELMNEPVFDGNWDRWTRTIQPKLMKAVRKAAPGNPIVVSGAFWAGSDALTAMEPYPDPNLFYKFHYYRPYSFTHQGADWDVDAIEKVGPIPFPAYPEPYVSQIDGAIAQADDPDARGLMSRYRDERWTAASIAADLKAVKEWQARTKTTVIMNEFGVYQLRATPESQRAWLTAVVGAARRYGWGWTLWEWKDQKGFGLFQQDPTTGEMVLQTQVLNGIGMTGATASGPR